MTQPALKFTGLRGNEVRELEGEYNRIWKEIEDEVKNRIKALIDSDLEIRTYVDAGPVSMPSDYSQYLMVYDAEGNYVGQIPIF